MMRCEFVLTFICGLALGALLMDYARDCQSSAAKPSTATQELVCAHNIRRCI